jgi:hypothetical protein
MSMSESRRVVGHTSDRAAVLVDDDHRTRRWRHRVLVEQRFDHAVGELGEIARLPVVAETRR